MGYVLSESLSERAGFLPFLLWQRIAHDIVMFNQTSQNYLTMNSFVHMLCDKGTLWVDFVDGSSWCVSTPKCSQFTMMSSKYLIYWQIRHTRMKRAIALHRDAQKRARREEPSVPCGASQKPVGPLKKWGGSPTPHSLAVRSTILCF